MSSTRRLYQAVALAILLLVLLVTYLLLLSSVAELPVVWDFTIYYASARHFWEGQSLYAAVPVDALGTPPESIALARDTLHANLSPPPAMLLMAPLGLWSYTSAYSIWTIVSILCGLAAVVCLGTTLDREDGRTGPTLVLGILLLAYFPTFVNVQLGQVALVLLLLLSIVWVAARGGRDTVAGVALGLALTMKLFAALLLLYFLVRRRWRLAAWSAATLLLTTAAGLLVFGPASFREYLRALETVTWYASNWNASFLGFLTRILGGSENVPLVGVPGLAHALSYGLSLAGILALVWLSWPRVGEPLPAIFDLGFGLTLALMLLVSPLGWIYYLPLMLIALAGAWRVSGPLKWALVVAWILSTVPTPVLQAVEVNDPLSWFTWASVYFYAALAFTLALGIILWRLRRGVDSSLSSSADCVE
jgi:alpha-1,2-mannosyltransferase